MRARLFRRQSREELDPRNAGAKRQREIVLHALAESLRQRGGLVERVRRVDVRPLETLWLDRLDLAPQAGAQLAGTLPVARHVGLDRARLGTALERLEHRHAERHAGRDRLGAGRLQLAALTRVAPDDHGAAHESGVEGALDRGVKEGNLDIDDRGCAAHCTGSSTSPSELASSTSRRLVTSRLGRPSSQRTSPSAKCG